MANEPISFRDLGDVPVETLYKTFVEAFSDYEVPLALSLDDFTTMHARRGVVYTSSLGAFESDRLVGFIFNGDGQWQGRRCAYDAGTGVVPSHRGIGLSKRLASEALDFLKARGFSLWLLEVLVGNEKAIRTYEGAGFSRTRRFRCPDGTIADPAALARESGRRADVDVRELGHRDTRRFASVRSWEPSWQNSDDSVERSPEHLVTLGAFAGGSDEPEGYVVATDRGSICQLAVREGWRRRGIGTALVANLALRSKDARVRYVNVQSDDEGTLGLLASLGIESAIDQCEMVREIR